MATCVECRHMASAATTDTAATGVKWDLSALFSSTGDTKIESTWKDCHARADKFASDYRGKVADLDANQMLAAIRELESLSNEASKPAHFAGLIFAADTSNAANGAFLQEQSEKSSELRVKLMFFDLELQKLSQDHIDALMQNSDLAVYGHYVSVVRAYTPYMLSEAEEMLLEETSNTGVRAWVRLHEEVTANHEFRYTDPHTSEVQTLSQEEVLEKFRDGDRAIRQAAADAFTQGMHEMQRVICFAYNTILADKKLEDRLREMEYPERSRHLANELDKQTVDVVMQLCKQRGDLVARYYKVKRQILGLDELTHIDRYAPLFESTEKISWLEGKKMVLDSFQEFSPILRDRALEFFDKNWIDAEPRKGKGGGAFCSSNTPDTHPVMLMTYLGSLNDVGTLAHELGHCVHASLSRKQSAFNFHGTLPLAELASIFGEMLVFDKLVGAASEEDRLALYAEKVEGTFASVHRQAAMFRFEQRCHTHRREQGELASEDFQAIWQEEMQAMFADGLTLGEQHACWWQYVSHFFFAPFYVYAYSFGELLTMSLYKRAQSEGEGFAAKYIDVLERGGSETPFELMGRLGVDLRSKEFWQGGFDVLENMIAEFERLWAARQASP